ncbi:MAG: zinc-dependent metalloprotease [Chitinophagales bacterium]
MRLVLPFWAFCLLFVTIWSNGLYAQHRCATMEAMEIMYEQNPSLQKTIEQNLSKIHNTANEKVLQKKEVACPTGGTITIPVVVHVLYNPNQPVTNISEAQIESQICQLNTDYGGTNQDLIEALDGDGNKDLVAAIANAASDGTCIQFCLATFDHPQSASLNPDGLVDGEKAIIRRSLVGLPTDFPPSFQNTAGSNDIWEISPIWDRNQYLNFWIVPSIGGGGILGFAQLPNGPAATDGIVIQYENFGSSSPDCGPCAGCALQPNFNWGRTATHEVGHWLSLYHTWGTQNGCGEANGDGIFDTPNQFQSSSEFFCNVSGFPPLGDQCTPVGQGGIMYMNYMDYSADACLILFSQGQQAAMETLLTSGFRSNFGNNDLGQVKCTPITDPPIASFIYNPDPLVLCPTNGKIKFTDTSQDNPTQWTWSFTVLNGNIGLDIVSSSNRNPEIQVLTGTSGTIQVSLQVNNSLGSDTFTQTISVTLSEDACPSCEGGIFAGVDITTCPNETITLNASLGNIGASDETTTATIGTTNLTGAIQGCISLTSQPSVDVTAFTFSVPPANTTINQTGAGSIKQVCVNISVANNNGTYLSIDHNNGAYEDLWIGTGIIGGFNGNGGNTINVCFTAGQPSGAFDGIFDGGSGGGSFLGENSSAFVLYVMDFGCLYGGTTPPTINSASLVINDGDGGFDCQFLRWEVSGVSVGTSPTLEVTPSTGGTVFYTAVADCEGFICTDEVAINVLPNVSSGLSSTIGTADNPFEVCGNEEVFNISSIGPYSYDTNNQTIAWGLWVIEDPFGQTTIDAAVLPGSPPNDDDLTDDTNFLGFYGTEVMGATGQGTVSLPVEGDGATYYLAPMIINFDNSYTEECAGVSTQGTYVKQYIALSADVLTESCSDDVSTTTITFNGGLPFDDYLSNEPNHTEAYTVSIFNDATPNTELVPAGQQIMLWENASVDLMGLTLGNYTIVIEDGAGCQVIQGFTILPDCDADLVNQIDNINGPPSQSFPDFSNQTLEAADDFAVPNGGMTIDAIQVTGSFNRADGVANNVKVTISVDFFGEPSPVPTYSATITPTDPSNPNFYLPLPTSLQLNPGKYWISIVPSMSFTNAGQWFWNATNVQTLSPAVFRDTDNLLDQGFTDWTTVNGNVGNDAAVDLSFALLVNASAGTPNTVGSHLLCCNETIDVVISGAKYDCTSFRLAWAIATTDDVAGVQAAINSADVLFANELDSYSFTHSCTDGLDAGTYYFIPFLANKYENSPMLIDECSIIGDGLQIGLTDPIEADNVDIVCALGENTYNIVVTGLQGGANNGGNPVLEGAEYVFEDASGTLTATYNAANNTYTIQNVSITNFNTYTISIGNSIAGQSDNCSVTFNGFTAPDCCAPLAGLPQAPSVTELCSDGTGMWSFAASVGFDENPSDGTVGTPDYAYLITSSGAVSIIKSISTDGSYTNTEVGTVCVYGIAYNAAALQLAGMSLEDFVGESTFSMSNDLTGADLCYALTDDAAYCLEAIAPIEGALVSIVCSPSGETGTLSVDLSGVSGGSGTVSIAANSPDKNGDAINSFPYAYTVLLTDEAGCELTLTGTVNCDVACTPNAGVLTAPTVTEGCLSGSNFVFAAPSFSVIPSGFGADAYVYVVVTSSNTIAAISNNGAFTATTGGEYCVYGLKYNDGGSVNPNTFVGSSLSSLNTALGNASVCFDLTDNSYCVNAYGAIENVAIDVDCAVGGASGTLQIDLNNASGGSGSGYQVAANSPSKNGDNIIVFPHNYTVIVTDGFGCTTSLTGNVNCAACPTISNISNDMDACSGDNVSLSVTVSDPAMQLDKVEWSVNGSVIGTGTNISVSETVTNCSNKVVTYTANAICDDGFTVSEEVMVTYYPQVSATANVSADGCTISVVPACSQFVIEGLAAGQTAVVSTDIDGDNSAVFFNVSNPNAPMACNSVVVTENYSCVLPECPTISSIVEFGKSAVDFSICSEDELQLQVSINDPNNQLDRVEWTSASLPNPVLGTQIMISETLTGCDSQIFIYTVTAYCLDGSSTTETVNVTVYPLPDADVVLLDGGCLLQATPTCSDFAINGNSAGTVVTMTAEPGNQSAVTFNVVSTTAVNAGVDCGTMAVTTNFNCAACAANAGTMPSEEQWICDGSQTNIQTSGENLSMGDVLTYVLHDSPSTTLGQVFAVDVMGRFDANDVPSTVTRYYVSAIVGPDADNNGTPDLEDPCTTFAVGAPVRFLNPIASSVAYDASATPNRVDAIFTITGGSSEVDGSDYSMVVLSTGDVAGNVAHGESFTITGLQDGELITLEVTDASDCSNMFEYTDIEEENILLASFVVKPVPAKDFIQLDFNTTSAATATIRLYSVDGKVLLQQSQQGKLGANTMELNLQSLPTGMYFLSLNYDGMVVNRKVVKE